TQAVSQRALEIGLRLALGASRRHVVLMVARRVALQLLLGFVCGVGLVMAWSRAFASGRADTSVNDPWTLVLAALGLAILAAIATMAPIVRALRVDPLVTLRT